MGKRKTKETDSGLETPAATAAMMAMNPVFAKAWIDLMSEGARFATERLRADMEMQQAMLACKSPAELMQLQSDFLRRALVQYSEETAKFYQMTFKASSDIAEDVRSGHSREYDDIPI